LKPGITGWAQVNGRNVSSWNERFEKDIWYVKNKSWVLDVRILFLTIKKVFLRVDVSSDGRETMIDLRDERGVDY